MQIFTQPNFNFIRWRWHAIALSLVDHDGMPVESVIWPMA